ncbi:MULTISPECIES: VOC family protein [Paenibacillus]|jgi:catechol 2,3-dioxygenase-like lactoylglutathione lyase family enzyme|uniref:VOC family protein n=1 Tax=Paenibacillus TaxID=44249 RepID=UPI0002D9C3F2|nr:MULTISPECIES: VOC family protein [Paenibacillus]AUS28973.1 glyoxalase [Paenibacillus polymyxa]KAF6621211.1 VOC family protein [Paenibacillus sp. EKM101P]KAF6622515.1 VOC family protein [Paenibacillus sp. EKM102P]KAF6632363.1 VOC family protein [Paenibacillus sp. EKM10P]KAF6647119.1 VOC family protein [Paenibacillus sp. EKM11P]
MSVKGLAHVAIQARDYQATIAFYTEVLGFKRGHHWSLPSFRIQEASMLISPDQRTCLEIFDNDAVIPAQGKKAASEQDIAHGALLHLAFYVDNVDEIYQKALVHGARTFVEPNQLTLGEPPLVVTNALVHSPNGEVIEFIEDVDFDMSQSSKK